MEKSMNINQGEIDKSLLLQVHKTIAKTLNPTYKIN
jgi:hypothetical protein